jgi:hypothetical protein
MASKGQTAERADTRLKITRAEDAELLVGSALEALDRLEPLIDRTRRPSGAGKENGASQSV